MPEFRLGVVLLSLAAQSLQIATGVPDGRESAVWCSGYGMALVDVPSLDQSEWMRAILLAPLGTRTLTARILPSDDGVSLAGADVRVFYVADWLCGFFELPDCMIPMWQVAVNQAGADHMPPAAALGIVAVSSDRRDLVLRPRRH